MPINEIEAERRRNLRINRPFFTQHTVNPRHERGKLHSRLTRYDTLRSQLAFADDLDETSMRYLQSMEKAQSGLSDIDYRNKFLVNSALIAASTIITALKKPSETIRNYIDSSDIPALKNAALAVCGILFSVARDSEDQLPSTNLNPITPQHHAFLEGFLPERRGLPGFELLDQIESIRTHEALPTINKLFENYDINSNAFRNGISFGVNILKVIISATVKSGGHRLVQNPTF